ncbi:hypothetical protein C8F01DRAFT_750944 [Mycena amicta]|nr:hypothetical protein C8F01DRAFT_750944 [Mycena amicta]
MRGRLLGSSRQQYLSLFVPQPHYHCQSAAGDEYTNRVKCYASTRINVIFIVGVCATLAEMSSSLLLAPMCRPRCQRTARTLSPHCNGFPNRFSFPLHSRLHRHRLLFISVGATTHRYVVPSFCSQLALRQTQQLDFMSTTTQSRGTCCFSVYTIHSYPFPCSIAVIPQFNIVRTRNAPTHANNHKRQVRSHVHRTSSSVLCSQNTCHDSTIP